MNTPLSSRDFASRQAFIDALEQRVIAMKAQILVNAITLHRRDTDDIVAAVMVRMFAR